MNAAINPLDSMISAKRAEVTDAERVLERLRIELAQLEKAHAQVASLTPRRRNHRQKPKRGRSLSDGWARVLADIGGHGERGATTDQILAHCTAVGLKLARDTLRGQMSHYAKAGLVERIQDGVFRLTPAGAKAAGVESSVGVKNAPPEGRAS